MSMNPRVMNLSKRINSALSIPHDVVSDIMSRLPVKSLCRFRCVSKHWNSTISDHRFIKIHANMSSSRPGGDATAIVVAFPENIVSRYAISVLELYYCKDNEDHPDSPNVFLVSGEISQSLNGLILLEKDPYRLSVFNPSTRENFHLPDIELRDDRAGLGRLNHFGYDPINDQHKVLSQISYFWYDKGDFKMDNYVFVIGGDGSWRRLDDDLDYMPGHERVCVNGILYWRVVFMTSNVVFNAVIAFDVRSETFQSVSVPPSCTSEYYDLMQFDGHLAIVIGGKTIFYGAGEMNVWVLCDTLEPNWTHKHFVFPSSWTNTIIKEPDYVHIVGQCKNGEIMMATRSKDNPISLIYVNFEIQRVRIVEIMHRGKRIHGFIGTRVTPHIETLVACIRGD